MSAPDFRALLAALVASLPKCGAWTPPPGAEGLDRLKTCDAPATKANGRGGMRYCDEHAPPGTDDYPRAEPLRRAVAALREERGGAP